MPPSPSLSRISNRSSDSWGSGSLLGKRVLVGVPRTASGRVGPATPLAPGPPGPRRALSSPPVGQTRVDLQHLLEDLRDAYPDAIEETILSEVIANALDSGASHVRVLTDPSARTVVFVDDGCGMGRRDLARYHDLASSTKTRGEGIGFAGVGIKLGLLVAESVLTETRRAAVHVATRWRLASRHKAPWQWVDPPGWVHERGTAIGLHLRNPLSALLEGGYLESRLRLHFEPLFDPAFDDVLRERYPGGVRFSIDGRALERSRPADRRATILVRLPRKRKPAAYGFLERRPVPPPEQEQGLAVSTLGKVIRRGWDWIGLSSSSPGLVGGLIEAPGLSAALTLNKGDFVRAGRRGITYLAYRKAMQEAVQAQLTAWGEATDREDAARRRATRPLERDLESVLIDLASEFPALSALVERRAGGQRRLPAAALVPSASALEAAVAAESGHAGRAAGGDTGGEAAEPTPSAPMADVAADGRGPAPAPADSTPDTGEDTSEEAAPPGPGHSILEPPGRRVGPRRPGRYSLSVDFEDRPESSALGRLVESTVLVNTAHPAYHASARVAVRGLPRRAHGGDGARGRGRRARRPAGLRHGLSRPLGRGDRPRPPPAKAPAPAGSGAGLSGLTASRAARGPRERVVS